LPSLLTSRRKAFLKIYSVTLQLRFLDVSPALLQNPSPKIAAFFTGPVGEEDKRENAPLGTTNRECETVRFWGSRYYTYTSDSFASDKLLIGSKDMEKVPSLFFVSSSSWWFP
jgi:hypothetical protein